MVMMPLMNPMKKIRYMAKAIAPSQNDLLIVVTNNVKINVISVTEHSILTQIAH